MLSFDFIKIANYFCPLHALNGVLKYSDPRQNCGARSKSCRRDTCLVLRSLKPNFSDVWFNIWDGFIILQIQFTPYAAGCYFGHFQNDTKKTLKTL